MQQKFLFHIANHIFRLVFLYAAVKRRVGWEYVHSILLCVIFLHIYYQHICSLAFPSPQHRPLYTCSIFCHTHFTVRQNLTALASRLQSLVVMYLLLFMRALRILIFRTEYLVISRDYHKMASTRSVAERFSFLSGLVLA